MAKIEASKTCFSLSATAPATDDLAGRAGIADYAAFRIVREVGDQTTTRAVKKG